MQIYQRFRLNLSIVHGHITQVGITKFTLRCCYHVTSLLFINRSLNDLISQQYYIYYIYY
jgi:hypothetical protein